MIKIAYIIDTIEKPTAGTEKQILNLLTELNRSPEISIDLICLYTSDWLSEQSFSYKLKIFKLQKISSRLFWSEFLSLIKYLKSGKYDIVQTFFKQANYIGTLAAWIAGIHIVISSRRNIGHWHTKFHLLSLRLLRYLTTHYLSNSKAVAEYTIKYEKVSPEKINVIYNGIDLRKFRECASKYRDSQRKIWNIKDDEILIGMVANLREVKNYNLLLSTASGLILENPKLKFVAIGDGPLKEEMQAYINKYNMNERFFLVGKVDDVYRVLPALDIAVLTSKAESFSNSVIEYMAAGIPSVVSNVGGNAEAITHLETGYVFNLEDPEDFKYGLLLLSNDKDLRTRMGKSAAVQAMHNYGMQQISKQYIEYYKGILCSLNE